MIFIDHLFRWFFLPIGPSSSLSCLASWNWKPIITSNEINSKYYTARMRLSCRDIWWACTAKFDYVPCLELFFQICMVYEDSTYMVNISTLNTSSHIPILDFMKAFIELVYRTRQKYETQIVNPEFQTMIFRHSLCDTELCDSKVGHMTWQLEWCWRSDTRLW